MRLEKRGRGGVPVQVLARGPGRRTNRAGTAVMDDDETVAQRIGSLGHARSETATV